MPVSSRRPVKASKPVKPANERQKKFVDAKMLGKTDGEAAKEAGFATTAPNTLPSIPAIKAELAAARRWLTDATQITRLDVIEGIIDGIEMARHLGDPGNVIRGWETVAKLLGYAQPDIKAQNVTVNQMILRNKFETMELSDLLRIAGDDHDSTKVIEHGTH